MDLTGTTEGFVLWNLEEGEPRLTLLVRLDDANPGLIPPGIEHQADGTEAVIYPRVTVRLDDPAPVARPGFNERFCPKAIGHDLGDEIEGRIRSS